MSEERNRLVKITLDEDTLVRRSPEVEHERAVAIYDLLEENSFSLLGNDGGPFALHIGIQENRLLFDVRGEDETELERVTLPLSSFRNVIRDYFRVCEAYYEAIKVASPSKIEAIDMGRRALHNEGAELLRERLAAHIRVDGDTERRLFTLICVLHVRDWRE
ncbi:MAG: UPF0262 family protein [Alphaproteobacteria bacterium]